MCSSDDEGAPGHQRLPSAADLPNAAAARTGGSLLSDLQAENAALKEQLRQALLLAPLLTLTLTLNLTLTLTLTLTRTRTLTLTLSLALTLASGALLKGEAMQLALRRIAEAAAVSAGDRARSPSDEMVLTGAPPLLTGAPPG